MKVAHHFSGGASVVLGVRPGGTIGYQFWSNRVRSIVQRFTSDALPRIRGQSSNYRPGTDLFYHEAVTELSPDSLTSYQLPPSLSHDRFCFLDENRGYVSITLYYRISSI